MTLIDPSILSLNNLRSQTSDTNSSSSTVKNYGIQMNHGKILQLAKNGTQIFSGNVKARVIGTHLTSGKKVCYVDRSTNSYVTGLII